MLFDPETTLAERWDPEAWGLSFPGSYIDIQRIDFLMNAALIFKDARGVGSVNIRWCVDHNKRKLIDLVEQLVMRG